MGATEKISVIIGRDELARAKQLASKLGLSLSTFITDAVRERVAEQGRKEAARSVLATFGAEDRATEDEMSELLTRWGEAGRSKAVRLPAKEHARTTKRLAGTKARRK
jgi:hypothetical protein